MSEEGDKKSEPGGDTEDDTMGLGDGDDKGNSKKKGKGRKKDLGSPHNYSLRHR